MLIQFLTSNQQLIAEINQFCTEWEGGQSEFVVYTSGSTGAPKPIRLMREHMKASASATNEFFQNKKGSTALLCLSPTTIGGKMMIVRALEAGMKLVVVEPSSTPLTTITEPIDFAAMVPLQVQQSLLNTPNKFELVKRIIIGGAAVSNDLKQQLAQFNTLFYQTFGMTETISHFALKQLSPSEEAFYTCLPGVTIGSDDGSLTINYPALGIESLVTNDLIQLIDANRFKWLGRSDFTINSGGIKIHPEQVEILLAQLIPVPFFSFGVKDELLGERHVLAIESLKEIDLSKAQLSGQLSKYELPKELWYFSTFHYTESGKLNRRETLKSAPHFVGKVL